MHIVLIFALTDLVLNKDKNEGHICIQITWFNSRAGQFLLGEKDWIGRPAGAAWEVERGGERIAARKHLLLRSGHQLTTYIHFPYGPLWSILKWKSLITFVAPFKPLSYLLSYFIHFISLKVK